MGISPANFFTNHPSSSPETPRQSSSPRLTRSQPSSTFLTSTFSDIQGIIVAYFPLLSPKWPSVGHARTRRRAGQPCLRLLSGRTSPTQLKFETSSLGPLSMSSPLAPFFLPHSLKSSILDTITPNNRNICHPLRLSCQGSALQLQLFAVAVFGIHRPLFFVTLLLDPALAKRTDR